MQCIGLWGLGFGGWALDSRRVRMPGEGVGYRVQGFGLRGSSMPG